MSFSMFIYIVSCMGSYKLGAYNQRQPGKVWEKLQEVWRWMNK
jgi:hypothetical protein